MRPSRALWREIPCSCTVASGEQRLAGSKLAAKLSGGHRGPPSFALPPSFHYGATSRRGSPESFRGWYARRGSNPQPSAPEADALSN